ncbi:hypothetical protein BMS3Abin02_01362 [bacterium BMS3Abin02]|nr:hypothetical protein BMS3Abin02_01362 [bacterium BMS3Abin02]GBE22747.1 hypothetical protein BMS3Bbin01_02123 [bacterium BMS3Bbin01]HDK45183.1 hypothetical protein [Actinomycetota bacterium]
MSETEGSEPVYCSEGIQILRALEAADEGWERRTVTDPARIAELEELYSSLGFETMVTGLDPSSFGEACTSCAVTACSEYVALFTRKRDVG